MISFRRLCPCLFVYERTIVTIEDQKEVRQREGGGGGGGGRMIEGGGGRGRREGGIFT